MDCRAKALQNHSQSVPPILKTKAQIKKWLSSSFKLIDQAKRDYALVGYVRTLLRR